MDPRFSPSHHLRRHTFLTSAELKSWWEDCFKKHCICADHAAVHCGKAAPESAQSCSDPTSTGTAESQASIMPPS